jgi:hypothetical protein
VLSGSQLRLSPLRNGAISYGALAPGRVRRGEQEGRLRQPLTERYRERLAGNGDNRPCRHRNPGNVGLDELLIRSVNYLTPLDRFLNYAAGRGRMGRPSGKCRLPLPKTHPDRGNVGYNVFARSEAVEGDLLGPGAAKCR